MGIGRRGQGPWPPWIFIHDTDKVEAGIMMLFFGIVFPLPLPLESAHALAYALVLQP